MLNRQQLLTLLMMRNREGNLFNKVPVELIREISEFGRDDKEFNTALLYVADGELDKLRKILDDAKKEKDNTRLKELLLLSGTVVTPGGLTVKNTTLLECALGSGDPEMIALLKFYFPLFEGGEIEMERQLARYRPCIDAIQNQTPDDLTSLFDVIKKSSLQDVHAELATGTQYDPKYTSDLRTALNAFREMKLDPKNRIMTKPRMHCNYQNLISAYEKLDAEWNDLKVGSNYDKHYLVSQQIIGLIQLIEMPANERFIYARGQVEEATKNQKIERSNNYKYGSGSFPRFDKDVFKSHSGVGFDSFISIYDGAMRCGGPGGRGAGGRGLPPLGVACRGSGFTKLMSSKNNKLAELMQQRRKPKPDGCKLFK